MLSKRILEEKKCIETETCYVRYDKKKPLYTSNTLEQVRGLERSRFSTKENFWSGHYNWMDPRLVRLRTLLLETSTPFLKCHVLRKPGPTLLTKPLIVNRLQIQ